MTTLLPGPLPEPTFSPDQSGALREYWAFYESNIDAIQRDLMAAIEQMPEWAPLIKSLSPAQLEQQKQRGLETQRAGIVNNQWQAYLADLYTQGAQYAKAGVRFASWFQIIAVLRTVVRHRLLDLAKIDLQRATRVGDGMNCLLDFAMSSLGEAYLETKQDIIREQQEAIREISTPVLQVREKLLIIPIVGLVDTHRARLLTEGLLRAIRERRAKGVVMDITGVPIVDSKVANHIAQACEAARLMGALVVLTGISPDIAQTLVTIGAQLRGVRTVGDLQGGIEEVERFLAEGAITGPEDSAASASAP